MGETKSEDWLPPGWTVKERVRENGKKDKIYYAPSNGPAFNSRAEVSRYLSVKQTDDCKPKRKNQGTLKPSANVVLVEKVDAEGLPPGWIKEVRLRKSAGTIRRDPFYYDPVSKNVFRSLKAVNRYLKTEEPGMPAQNSEGSSHKDPEDDCTASTKVIKKQQLGVSRTRRQINFGRISDMNEIQDKQVHTSSSQPSPLSEHASEPREGGTELRNSDIQEAEDLDQKGDKDDASKRKFDEVLPTKQSLRSGKAQLDLRKSKKKTAPDLPRRASKRLAGLEVDPIPELKPKTRARRLSIEESGNGVTSTNEGSSPGSSAQDAVQQSNQLETDSKSSGFSQHSQRIKNFSDNLVPSEKRVGKAETVIDFDEKQKSPVFPMESQISPYDKAEEKLEAPLDLPLGELLTDPCIAFAIKTLTGVSFYQSESSEVLNAPISSEHSSENLAMDIFGKVETQSKIDGEQDHSSAVSLEEHARSIENDTKADEKSGSPIEFPFGGAWQDPCIEFAIKTLTDAIPLDYDPSIQQYFQQQLSSSKTQGSDEMSFTSVGQENLFQTDSSCQQFPDVEKPRFQREFQVPPSGTVSLQSPDESALYKRGKERQ